MITPSFGLTATERVLPRLALDFTTASLDPRITFTRTGNTATRINSSGYIETVNADLPRFDYNPITLACKGLLIEETRANIFEYSEDFSQPYWVQAQATVTTAQGTSPANTNTANLVSEQAVNADHGVYAFFGATNATPYTASIFAKKKDRDFIFFTFFNNNGVFNGNHVWFNLATGQVATVQAGITATITAYKDGWYRCTATQTSAATAGGYVGFFQSTVDAELTYVGDTAKGTYMWGAQLEVGSFPTSYIPTTTTSLTRNADVATMTGTNFSDWFNAAEGALQVSGFYYTAPANTTQPPLASINDGTINNSIEIRRSNNNGSPFVRMAMYDTGALQTSSNLGATQGQPVNAVFAYKVNDLAGAINGNATILDTVATVPSNVDRLQIGYNNTAYMNGWLSKINYYPQRLTNNEVRAFSK